jgi:hypothetical protein
MCWFQWGITTSSGFPAPANGLGFLPGSNSVHHDSEPARRPVYLEAVRSGELPSGWAVDDGAALLFRGSVLADVITARPGARAYAVGVHGERALPARPLTTVAGGRTTVPAVAELRRLHLARHGIARD